MLDMLRQILNVFVLATTALDKFLSLTFSLSHAIGFQIVNFLILAYSVLSNIFSSVFNVLKILYEDFCFFGVDLLNIIITSITFLYDNVTTAYYLLKGTIVSIKSYITYIFESIFDCTCFVLDSICKSFGLVVDFAELLKWIVILIGQGFWLALQLIPLCLLYIAYSILNLVVFLITASYEQIWALATYMSSKVVLTCSWSRKFFLDFPIEALLGLTLGSTLLYLTVKYNIKLKRAGVRFRRAMIQSVKRTVRLMRTACICVWLVVLQKVQAWRRVNVQAVIDTGSDSDSTQDEMVAMPASQKNVRLRLNAKRGQIETPSLLRRQLEQEKEEKLCIVCQDRNRCVICLPCRHLCLCVECSDVIMRTSETCPICRKNLELVLPVFM